MEVVAGNSGGLETVGTYRWKFFNCVAYCVSSRCNLGEALNAERIRLTDL